MLRETWEKPYGKIQGLLSLLHSEQINNYLFYTLGALHEISFGD